MSFLSYGLRRVQGLSLKGEVKDIQFQTVFTIDPEIGSELEEGADDPKVMNGVMCQIVCVPIKAEHKAIFGTLEFCIYLKFCSRTGRWIFDPAFDSDDEVFRGADMYAYKHGANSVELTRSPLVQTIAKSIFPQIKKDSIDFFNQHGPQIKAEGLKELQKRLMRKMEKLDRSIEQTERGIR